MPKLDKADRRDKARRKAQKGMRISGTSVFTIQRRQGERAQKVLRRKSSYPRHPD